MVSDSSPGAPDVQGLSPIAIIGMGCRFPGGGHGPTAFWQALKGRIDGVRDATGHRFQQSALPAEWPALRWAGLLDSIDGFDAGFFGISAHEATMLDPQQRLLLEVAWEALEDAGQRPDALMGSQTGVFVGISNLDYERMLSRNPERMDAYSLIGNLMSTGAGRLSSVLGLQGPSLAVETSCSSSLVAVHLACQSLRTNESRMAVAGGVNLILSPLIGMMYAQGQVLSPDGRCKTFDRSANGIVRGEGCGMVVLKRLADALRDGDRIWALIRGSATNQAGRSTGLAAPNVGSQEALLRQALANARIAPSRVGYVETHGTGTALGDPVEVAALRAVLGQTRQDGSPCVLGAVKTNLGHLESAAGVAGLIKAALALHHQEIPPNLHFHALHPALSLAETPLVVAGETVPWPAAAVPRVAGVSAFGVTGTNAHVVLEEAPQEPVAPRAAEDRLHLLPLSARSPAALHSLMDRYERFLMDEATAGPGRLADIAYTASARRGHNAQRVAVVGRSAREWLEALQAARAGLPETPAHQHGLAPPKVVFVFSGHGSQWVGMGRQLFAAEPVFRAAIVACDEAIQREAGWSVVAELHADDGAVRKEQADIVQPLLFAVEVALATLWRSWGVVPDAVVGHSMGEIAAAYVAGALNLEQAARIICRRSVLLWRLRGHGLMALVELPFAQAEQAIRGREERLAVAVSNSPSATVLSGDREPLEELLGSLEARGIGCRRLKWAVSAGHSPQVDPLLPELRSALSALRPAAARTVMYSTVTGRQVADQPLDAEYWLRNMREPVKFSQTIRRMLDDGFDLFVELSPHPLLVAAMEEVQSQAGRGIFAAASLRRNKEERRCLLEAVAALYARGCAPDWRSLHPSGGRCVTLPLYPWQHRRYWIDEDSTDGAALGPHPEGTGASSEDGGGSGAADWLAAVRSRMQDLAPPFPARLMEYLRAQVAAVLSLTVAAIRQEDSFRSLGMDSLSAGWLRNRINAALGISLSLAKLWESPTLHSLTECILRELGAVLPAAAQRDAMAEGRAFVALRQNPAARIRLLCFPYAGGGAGIYQRWARAFPEEVEPWVFLPPGRDERSGEPMHVSLSALLAEVSERAAPLLDRPFALYGHSFGAIVAYEFGRLLRRRGLPSPVHLFVGAAAAPDVAPTTAQPLAALDQRTILSHLRRLGGIPEALLEDPETCRRIFETWRSDIAILERYTYEPEPPLPCPISAFAGQDDPLVRTDAVDAWRRHSSAAGHVYTIPGGHFFLHSQPDALLTILREELSRCAALAAMST